MMRTAVLLAAVAAASSGCLLEGPRYEGTEFSCADPGSVCPDGYSCIDSVCRLPAPTGDPAAAPDAGSAPQPTVADASVPDGASPDATPQPTMTVTLSGTNATDDAHIEFEQPTHNHGNETYVSVDAGPIRVGLLRFDLSSIPSGSEIVAAEMVLNVQDPIEDGAFVVHVLLESWSEHETTWIFRRNGVPWASPGAGVGSYAPTPLFTLAAREAKAYTIALPTATVQNWVTQPLLNFGMKWTSSSVNGRGGEFDSSEATDAAAQRPVIRVTYR